MFVKDYFLLAGNQVFDFITDVNEDPRESSTVEQSEDESDGTQRKTSK